MICSTHNCFWNINEHNDIYCSGCGKKLLNIEANPSNSELLRIRKNSVTVINIHNKGSLALREIDLISNSDIKIVENPLTINPDESVKLAIKPGADEAVGSSGQFDVLSKPGNKILTFAYTIIDSSPLLLKIVNTIIKDDIYFIDSEQDKIEFSIHCDDYESIKKPELLYPEEEYLHIIFDENNKKTFQLRGINSLNNNDFLIRFSINPSGYSKDDKIFEFSFKKYDFPKLIEFINYRKHDCIFPDNTQTINHLQIIKYSALKKEIQLFVENTSNNNNFIITNIEVEDVLKKLSDNTEIESKPEKWFKCINKEKYLFNNYLSIDKHTQIEKEFLLLRFDVIPNNLPDELFIDRNNVIIDQPILFEATVAISYQDSFSAKTQKLKIKVPFEIFTPISTNITIDFGTTNSCIAYNKKLNQGDESIGVVIFDKKKELDQLPTVIRFLKLRNEIGYTFDLFNEEIAVSETDYELFLNIGEINVINSTAIGFKSQLKNRALNNQGMIFIDENNALKQFTPIELTALYFKAIIDKFESIYPYKSEKIHLTFPAVFSQYEKSCLLKALELCGYSRDRILLEVTEPIALAMYSIFKTEIADGETKLIGVFDCGGGTTDLTLVEYSNINGNNQVRFLASDGDDSLGGNYLTHRIAEYLYDSWLSEDSKKVINFPKEHLQLTEITESIDKKNYLHFYGTAENIKIINKTDDLMYFSNFLYDREGKAIQQDTMIKEIKKTKINDLFENSIKQPLEESLKKLNLLLIKANEKYNLLENYLSNEITNVLWIVGKEFIVFDNKGNKVFQEEFSSDDIDKLNNHYIQNVLEINADLDSEPLYHIIGLKISSDNKNYNVTNNLELNDYLINIPLKLDELILGGNSCRLKYIQELADEIVWSKSKPSFNADMAKTGVAKGAATYLYFPRNARRFNINGSKMIAYAIGYLLYGNFEILYDHWESEPFQKISSKKILLLEKEDLKIRIFENRDMIINQPNFFPHNPKKQPLIGFLNIPEELIGKSIKFTLLFNPDASEFSYEIYEFGTNVLLLDSNKMELV